MEFLPISFIVAWVKYEPTIALPPKCSWEDEGDEVSELPEWKPLSPLPSLMKGIDAEMGTGASSVQRKCLCAFNVMTLLVLSVCMVFYVQCA